MSCEICTEIFNKSTNSVVTCCHCSKTACKNCVRTYLLSIDDEAQCMFCNNPQDLVFLASNINKTWVHSTYKKHREKILLDKQVAQLPDTQDKAKRTRLSRQHTAEIEALNKQKKELVDNLKKINNEVDQILNKKSLLKKLDYSNKLVGQVKQEFQLPKSFVKKNLEKETATVLEIETPIDKDDLVRFKDEYGKLIGLKENERSLGFFFMGSFDHKEYEKNRDDINAKVEWI